MSHRTDLTKKMLLSNKIQQTILNLDKIFTEYSPVCNESQQNFDIKILLFVIGMNLKARHPSILLMTKCGQVNRVNPHHFMIMVSKLRRFSQTELKSVKTFFQFRSVYYTRGNSL